MAEIKVEVHTTSQEIIKPSSPTAHHLKSFKLCVFDQLSHAYYVPTLIFYPSSPHISIAQKLAKLKDSLSRVLTRFYPLAGRIKDFSTVDCNDEGVLFIEAKVNCELFDFLKPPKNELLNMLLPCKPTCTEPVEKATLIIIKANIFACGGIGFGICFLHKFIDGATVCAFIKAWVEIATTNCGQGVYANNITAASIFPPVEKFPTNLASTELAPAAEGKGSIKRFVFDSIAIALLKAKAGSEHVPNPTRTEAISGLIWKCLISPTATCTKPSMFATIINLRPRVNPPLPDHSIGNIFLQSIAYDDDVTSKTDKPLSYFADLLRKSTKKIDYEYLQKMQGKEGFKEFFKQKEDEMEIYSKSIVTCMCSSLTGMGFYEADFGWGKPVWIAVGPSFAEALNNVVFLIESRCGQGIEAWVSLDNNRMEKLEHDPEFKAYAKFNPDIQTTIGVMDLQVNN